MMHVFLYLLDLSFLLRTRSVFSFDDADTVVFPLPDIDEWVLSKA